jgi:plastocyanin
MPALRPAIIIGRATLNRVQGRLATGLAGAPGGVAVMAVPLFLRGAVMAAPLFLPSTVMAAPLSGHIELRSAGETLRSDEVRHAIVYFKPATAAVVRPASQPASIVMRKKEFVPRVLAVTVGSTVRFPNSDPILHNVFSVSGDNAFDLGLYPEGPGKAAIFKSPGLVRVFCNVHHDMVAYVLVLDTPYFASPLPDGNFQLANLPEGDGLLVAWHERTEPWSTQVHLPAEAPITVQLEISKPLVPQHADKTGKPYGVPPEKSYR